MTHLRLPVSLNKITALSARMEKLGLLESDMTETFIRSGGKGGQNVNKVSTAVRLMHRPSGKEVKCTVHRTQGMNRYQARVMLCERFEQQEREAAAIENPVHKKKRLAKLDRARKAKRKAKAKLAKKPAKENWKDSGEW